MLPKSFVLLPKSIIVRSIKYENVHDTSNAQNYDNMLKT